MNWDKRRRVTQVELEQAYTHGSASLYSAALFDNPNLTITPTLVADDSVPRELRALACAAFLTIDSSQDGAAALIERFGHMRGFLKGIECLGWLELTARLGKFLALMEPYGDDALWWSRFGALGEIGAFDEFDRWLADQELELDRRVEAFVRRNEAAIFVVVERLFSYGTLRQANVQQETFGRLLNGAPDALIGFKEEMVRITDPAVLATSGRLFHPIVVRSGNRDDRVNGTVFEITADELAAADRYEVSDYERVSAQLASGMTAWVYVKRA